MDVSESSSRGVVTEQEININQFDYSYDHITNICDVYTARAEFLKKMLKFPRCSSPSKTPCEAVPFLRSSFIRIMTNLKYQIKMKANASRRNWIKTISAGMAGLLFAERASGASQPFNITKALVAPRDDIKITKLEIIPVHSCRTIFVKMHTNAGIVGIGEGTVEGRIPTTVTAIQELEKY